LKIELNDTKLIIGLIVATVAAMVYFVPAKAFDRACDTIFKADEVLAERVMEVETRLDGIDTGYLKKSLDELPAKYGHTNCYQMPQPDQNDCLWIKDALARLGK